MSLSEDSRSRQGEDSNAVCAGGSESQHRQVNIFLSF